LLFESVDLENRQSPLLIVMSGATAFGERRRKREERG